MTPPERGGGRGSRGGGREKLDAFWGVALSLRGRGGRCAGRSGAFWGVALWLLW